jgi:hypothetical protein
MREIQLCDLLRARWNAARNAPRHAFGWKCWDIQHNSGAASMQRRPLTFGTLTAYRYRQAKLDFIHLRWRESITIATIRAFTMFSSSILWIGDMRKTPCVKIKPVQSRIFHLLQLDKVEISDYNDSAARLSNI